MKRLSYLLCLLSILLLGFAACDETGNGNDDVNSNINTDKCTLSQTVTAQDPDGDTSDISDIVQVETSAAVTDCPEDILNQNAVEGSAGTVEIMQTVSGQETELIVNLDQLWPFSLPADLFTGTRTSTEFTTIGPLHLGVGEGFCKTASTFGGTINSDQGKIEGTIGVTVHNVSDCL